MDVSNFASVYCSLEVSRFLLSVGIRVKPDFANSFITGSRNGLTAVIVDSSCVASFHVEQIRITFIMGINSHSSIAYLCFHYQN